MRSVVVGVVLVVIVIAVGGTLVYLNRQKVLSTPAPVTVSEPGQSMGEALAGKTPVAEAQTPSEFPANTDNPVPVPATNSVLNHSKSAADIAFSQTIDALLSSQTTAAQKHELFQQLIKAGQLDQAIVELKQRAAASPNDPEISTTLGEAQLNKLRALRDSGADYNAIGILAMQADQSFNAALKIDPQNWEAQFVKAVALSHWPADTARDNDVIQRLSGLIDQQETMTTQSEFAQTYIVLGEEYQKIGQPEKALATWQLGAQKFPNDPALQIRISGQ